MPKSFATLVDEVEQELQDVPNTLYTTVEIAIQLEDAVREVSEYDPDVRLYTNYEFETRTGTTSSTTAGAIVDDAVQFLAGDVGKVIFNTTDRTFAIVTAFVSTSQLTLSKDIMASGEAYEMFNQGCLTKKQIYLGDILNHMEDDHGVTKVEFEIGRYPQRFRNFNVEDDILTVDISFNPPDSATANANIEVHIWIAHLRQVSQLTDLVGTAEGAESAGATSMDVSDLFGGEVIAEGQEFVFTDIRGVYRVTNSGGVTLGGSGAGNGTTTSGNTLTFWPPVESDVADDTVVTFTGSSLKGNLERIVVELAAARCANSKGSFFLNQLRAAVTSLPDAVVALLDVASRLVQHVKDASSGRTALNLADEIILEANAEIDKMAAPVTTALSTLDEGRATINTITAALNVPGQAAAIAAQDLAASQAHMMTARAFLEQAAAQGPLAQSYMGSAATELQGAATSINQATISLQLTATQIAIVDRVPEFTQWARVKERRVLDQLERGLPPKQHREYPKVR